MLGHATFSDSYSLVLSNHQMRDYPLGSVPDSSLNVMISSTAKNITDVRLCSREWKDDSYKEFYEIAQVVTGLAIYPLACIPGVVGNALTIFVLSRRNMLTSTNAFLSALAVSDSIKLINDCMYILVTILLRTDPRLGNLAYGYLYPYAHFIFSMSVSVSSWLTVSVAAERYILVCHPTRARAFWNRQRAVLLCMSIYAIMTLLALPSAFRYRTVRCFDRKSNLSRVEVELTEIWQNQSIVTAYEWFQNLLRSTIPLIVLVGLNACIISALRRTNLRRRRNPRHRVTVMMIVVILVFLICITPDAILSTVFGFGYHEASYLGKGVREITDTLLTINAGVNFIIYCVFNQVFRKCFARMCCIHKRETGWVTELDESTYRRLSEAKCLLSTNNNIPSRQNTLHKVPGDKEEHGSQEVLFSGKRDSLVTLNKENGGINCSLTNLRPGEFRRQSSPLITSSSSSSSEPKDSNTEQHYQHPHQQHHHQRVSSSGLKKSRNSVKSNRCQKKVKFAFRENNTGKKPHGGRSRHKADEGAEDEALEDSSLWKVSACDGQIANATTCREHFQTYCSHSDNDIKSRINKCSAASQPTNSTVSNFGNSDELWNFRICRRSPNLDNISHDIVNDANSELNKQRKNDDKTREFCLKDNLKCGKKRGNLSVSFTDDRIKSVDTDNSQGAKDTDHVFPCMRQPQAILSTNSNGTTSILTKSSNDIILNETVFMKSSHFGCDILTTDV